jgi:hypothetical protein
MKVLLLLLDGDVVRNHVSELGIKAAVLEVAVPEALEVLVEVLEGRTSVEALASPVLLGSLGLSKLGLGEVGDLFDLEDTVLNDGLDEKSTVVGLLNSDVHAGREAGLGLLEFLSAILLAALVIILVVQVISQAGVIELLLLTDVLDVGDGKTDTDARRSNVLASIIENERKRMGIQV